MDTKQSGAPLRRVDDLADAKVRRAVISADLADGPIDEAASLEMELEGHLRRIDVPLSPERRSAVYRCVCEYVDAAKALGWAPEGIIVSVKGIARSAGLRPTQNVVRGASRSTGTDLLLGDMVAWCMRRYYATAEGPRR